ncbi:MAG: glycoside hydrolase family 3 protein [Bacteroidales bacterium]
MPKRLILGLVVMLICPSLLNASDSLRFKIAQMLIVGFRGTTLSPQNHIYRDIQKYRIGGVILFDYDAPSKKRGRNIINPIQVQKLVADLQVLSKGKFIVSIDQEGGKVDRLKQATGFSRTVSAQYLGQLNNIDSTRLYARKTAKQLKKLGFNLNFVPCVDLNINPNCPIIGKVERSFSANSDVIVKHSRVWVEEHRKFGIYTSLKHFPGHGSSTTDSHLGFTDVSETWTEKELIPYKKLIASGHCDMVMVSHVFNKGLDAKYPATLSHKMIDGVIRKQFGYNGLVITDDMAMGAIVDNYSLELALEKAVNAGVDILILSNNGKIYDEQIVPKVIEVIYNLVQKKQISLNRINNAYAKIKVMQGSL